MFFLEIVFAEIHFDVSDLNFVWMRFFGETSSGFAPGDIFKIIQLTVNWCFGSRLV